ncbi:MAG: DUF1501 domain-containing protein [Bryobacteraceae bacterium]
MKFLPPLSRRTMLASMGGGFGLLGLRSLCDAAESPFAPKRPHFAPKAKRVIFLFMNGGMSQVDTFDPKPMLARYHGHPVPGGAPKTERKTGSLMRSPFEFRRCGKSGIEVSEIFPKIGERIDDLCVIRSMYTDIPNHEPSLQMMNCGENLQSRPSMGSWLLYGLGTGNQNLPGYVVMCPGMPVVGTPLWNSSFLPAVFQGVHIPNNVKDPREMIQYLRDADRPPDSKRRQLDLLNELNRWHADKRGDDTQLEAAMQSMEVAFRMQTEAPEAFDIAREPESVRSRYGDSDFGRGCLHALRLAERGVRMVQLYFGNGQPWDNHDDIMIHKKLANQVDGPVAALLDDLKSRGLFDDTLVIFSGEFGRTPSVETSSRVKVQNGRDHNPHGFSMWLAGGGVKGGMTYGATDEFGFKAEQNRVHVHDLHATVLHLLGIDHTRLTYSYSGRDFRLTDVHGQLIREILA